MTSFSCVQHTGKNSLLLGSEICLKFRQSLERITPVWPQPRQLANLNLSRASGFNIEIQSSRTLALILLDFRIYLTGFRFVLYAVLEIKHCLSEMVSPPIFWTPEILVMPKDLASLAIELQQDNNLEITLYDVHISIPSFIL